MKKSSVILVIALILGLFVGAPAQDVAATNSVPPQASLTPPSDFFGSVKGYFTDVNHAYTFTNNSLEFAVGGDYMNGNNWGNYVVGQYDITPKWDASLKFRNIGILGPIQTIQPGVGYALINYYDVKATINVEAGWDFDKNAGIFEPGFLMRKKGTENTFFELGISWPIWTKGEIQRSPNIRIGTGFTF